MNIDVVELLWGVFYALLSTFGFSLLFNIDLKRLPLATVGGGLEWATYLVVFSLEDSVFVATLAATVIATFYSEICAHLCRTPATVFLMPALIPLVPGSSLYYTMSSLVTSDYDEALYHGINTLHVILGIAGGVVVASLIVYTVRSFKRPKQQ